MAIHLCRGLVSDHQMPDSVLYLMTLFLTGVVGYKYIGSSGSISDIDTSGSLNPIHYLLTRGVSASINLGGGVEKAVQIPTASYIVTSNDIGTILALRSVTNPRHNSGLFRVISVNTGSNYLFIDYQTSGSNPPAEVATLDFHLFLSESYFVANDTANSKAEGTYRGDFDAGCSRVILQSPHSSSWQVRLAREVSVVVDHNGVTFNGGSPISVAPGMSGTIYGDFLSGSADVANNSEHLHGQIWFNQQNFNLACLRTGTGIKNSIDTSVVLKFYAWGDDETGTTIFAYRPLSGSYSNGTPSGVGVCGGQWCGFGMVDEDGEPLPPKTIQRLFTFGMNHSNNNASIANNYNINWRFGPAFQDVSNGPDLYFGIAFGLNNEPVAAHPAPYVEVGGYLSDQANNAIVRPHIIDVSFAVDNALLGVTELQAVDLYAGTSRANQIAFEVSTSTSTNTKYRVFEFDPRRMGVFPIARFGRANFGKWVTTTDASLSWVHLAGGVYMPWEGPALT